MVGGKSIKLGGAPAIKNSFELIYGKSAQNQVLYYMLQEKDTLIHLSKIAENTGLSHSSVSRVVKPLIDSGILQEKALGQQIRIFELTSNPITQKIRESLRDIEALTNIA